jgi:uncharacterized protein (DUF1800 family)
MNPTLTALNRFGLGARPGEAARIRDPKAWLTSQLEGPAPQLEHPSLPAPAGVAEAMRGLRQAQAARDEAARAEARQRVRALTLAETKAALEARLTSERPFVERLVAFWSNHLCVSATKGQVAPLAGSYERDAIRPHVLGRFEDMVLASARHPAMLLYLDNAQSIGPGSQVGRMSAQRRNARGLNENYARELMELHTLGVNGGYTQEDVQELARVLTGWTVGGRGAAGGPLRGLRQQANNADDVEMGFAFLPALHEPGARTVLGRRYAQEGVEQGEAVIAALCAHPSTARFIATKLVRHFVADDPPAAAVDRVASAFSQSGGDLREVARALVALPEAWEPSRRKIRTPQDWVVAVLRALDTREAPPNLAPLLGQLRHPLWGPASPKGWGDTVTEWVDSDSLMNRAELAHTIAERAGPRVNPAALEELVDLPEGDPLPALLTDETIEASERLALAIAGPAFQWR